MTSSGNAYVETPNGDKLVLRGLKFHGFHGVKPEERVLGQKFLIDVDAWMDLQAAGNSDDLSDTISYTAIYRIVKEIVEGSPHNLLESVAQLIASSTLGKFPQISAVRVQVGKPHVAVVGPVDYLGVEIITKDKAKLYKCSLFQDTGHKFLYLLFFFMSCLLFLR